MNTKRKDNIYFTSIAKALKKTHTRREAGNEIDRLVHQVNLSKDKESYLNSKEYSFVFDLKQWEEFYNTIVENKRGYKGKEISKEKEIAPQSNRMIPEDLCLLAISMLIPKKKVKNSTGQ